MVTVTHSIIRVVRSSLSAPPLPPGASHNVSQTAQPHPNHPRPRPRTRRASSQSIVCTGSVLYVYVYWGPSPPTPPPSLLGLRLLCSSPRRALKPTRGENAEHAQQPPALPPTSPQPPPTDPRPPGLPWARGARRRRRRQQRVISSGGVAGWRVRGCMHGWVG